MSIVETDDGGTVSFRKGGRRVLVNGQPEAAVQPHVCNHLANGTYTADLRFHLDLAECKQRHSALLDWEHAVALTGAGGDVQTIMLCPVCMDTLPSRVASRTKKTASRTTQDARRKLANAAEELVALEDNVERNEARDRVVAGETIYFCPGCNELLDDAPIVVRECSRESCGTTYNGSEEGQNCPDCNNRFTRRYNEAGCPSCLDDTEVLTIRTVDEFDEAWPEDV